MTKKRHILFLSSWYPSRVLPTNGDFIQRHAEAVALVHQVTLIHVITDPKATGNIEISDKTINKVRTLIAYVKPSKLKYLRFLIAYKLLLKKAENFDLIHLNKLFPVGILALYLYYFKGIHFLLSEHHHIYQDPYNLKIGSLEKFFSRWITKKASFVCPVSKHLATAMQSFGLEGRYKVVPNVIKTDIFYPKKKKNKEVFTLLHVSNMADLKNVKGILEVIASLQSKIDEFEFYLIGKNAIKYQDYANTLQINPKHIHFINQINQEQLAVYYRKADVFLLFSEVETFSIVIYEAFSSGTAVVSSNIPAIKDNFPDNFGVLIEIGNTQQFLEGILKIYKGYINESPRAMHAYVENNFSNRSIAHQFTELYDKMV